MWDVIVIGAGISGLAAAKKLKEAGKNVLVLEARERAGGRIHTDRTFGTPVDVGSSWIYDIGQNTLFKDFKSHFELLPFGDLMSGLGKHVLYGIHQEKIEHTSLENIKKFVNDFFTYLVLQAEKKNLGEVLAEFKCSLFSTDELSVVKHWLSNLLAFWTGAELSETSVKVWQSMLESDGGQAYYVLNGYDSVVRQLAKGLNISFKNPVKCIDFKHTPVKVHTDKNSFEAKAVIVTLPIGVLQHGNCEFIPALPAEKQQAIHSIGCGLLDKAVLQFSHCFWDEQMLSIQCIPTENSAVQYYINFQAMKNVPILVAIYGGETAKQLATQKEAAQKEMLLRPLRHIYGSRFIEPEKILVTDWQKDNFAHCSYAYLPRGQTSDCFMQLSQPIKERIFFAGEATSPDAHATVHGAYETGLRAAGEVLQMC